MAHVPLVPALLPDFEAFITPQIRGHGDTRPPTHLKRTERSRTEVHKCADWTMGGALKARQSVVASRLDDDGVCDAITETLLMLRGPNKYAPSRYGAMNGIRSMMRKIVRTAASL